MDKKKNAPRERGAKRHDDSGWLIRTMVTMALFFVIDLIVLLTCCDSPEDVLGLILSLILAASSFARCLALWIEK